MFYIKRRDVEGLVYYKYVKDGQRVCWGKGKRAAFVSAHREVVSKVLEHLLLLGADESIYIQEAALE